jgi:AcrR family transcriptional regulator
VSRTPSPEAHEKVLEAATRLIGERGIEGASMDAIAQRSGVSKATVYKHWKDKDALCVDVVNRLRLRPPEFRSGNPRRDLLSLLTHLALASKPARLLEILPRIISYAAANPGFARAMQQSSMGPAEAHLVRILDDGMAKGVLRRDLDREIALNMLLGPILNCRMTRGSVPQRLPAEIVGSFWRSWGMEPAAKPPKTKGRLPGRRPRAPFSPYTGTSPGTPVHFGPARLARPDVTFTEGSSTVGASGSHDGSPSGFRAK